MLCLSGFELYSRWVLLNISDQLFRSFNVVFFDFFNHQTKALSTASFNTLRKNHGQLNRSYIYM